MKGRETCTSSDNNRPQLYTWVCIYKYTKQRDTYCFCICLCNQTKMFFCFFYAETWLGGGSKVHKQEEPGQIPDTVRERDQNTQGKSEVLFSQEFTGFQLLGFLQFMCLKHDTHIHLYKHIFDWDQVRIVTWAKSTLSVHTSSCKCLKYSYQMHNPDISKCYALFIR